MARNGMSVQIEGWEELKAKLRGLGDTIDSKELIQDALMEGAEIVQEAISSGAPYRTGQLSGDINISKESDPKYSVRIGPGKAGFYGRFNEFGTSKMAAQPFVRPAFDATRSKAQDAVGKAIWAKVEEAI